MNETPKGRPSYTARELEEETGFDRRTIAYYIQEGLLPRVGRRGPRTRYPKLARDRLLFIRRVREAEEAGEVAAVSLSDMRVVFERVSPSLIARVADGRIAITPELVERASTAFRLPGMRRMALEKRVFSRGRRAADPQVRFSGPMEPPVDRGHLEVAEGAGEAVFDLGPEELAEYHEGMDADEGTRAREGVGAYGQEDDSAERELAESLADLQERARLRRADAPESLDTWVRIEVTPDIVVSVRGVRDEDKGLVERVRWAMARVISARWRGGRG